MRNWLFRLSVVVLLTSGLANAQEASPETIAKNKLEQLLNLSVSSVADSPVDGLLQVMTNRGLFYVSLDGKFLVHGRVFNMDAEMLNETEEALGTVRVKGVEQFSDDMIEFKAENEVYSISIFTDITCGYCRKLHNEIEQYNKLGITVKYLAFPRGGVGSRSYDDMVSVWCADDQQSAMTQAKSGGEIASKTCATKVTEQYMFGQQVGVTGTPAIVLEDGSMIPGYQPAAQLAKVLATL